MSEYIHYLNGTWEKATLAKIPFNDAGFLLGDGLFETIRFDNNKLFQPIKHLERLFTSLNIIHINLQYSKKEIEFLLNETIIKNALYKEDFGEFNVPNGIYLSSLNYDTGLKASFVPVKFSLCFFCQLNFSTFLFGITFFKKCIH